MPTQAEGDRVGGFVRIAVAGSIGLAALVYLSAVLSGALPKDRQVGAETTGLLLFAVIGAGLVLRPDLLSRLSLLRLPGVELKLEQLEKAAEQQGRELDDVRFVLTLLLQEHEMAHLTNLASGRTQNYVGCASLRAELRKLRGLGLIEMPPGCSVWQIRDGFPFDLRSFAALTPRGRETLNRLAQA